MGTRGKPHTRLLTRGERDGGGKEGRAGRTKKRRDGRKDVSKRAPPMPGATGLAADGSPRLALRAARQPERAGRARRLGVQPLKEERWREIHRSDDPTALPPGVYPQRPFHVSKTTHSVMLVTARSASANGLKTGQLPVGKKPAHKSPSPSSRLRGGLKRKETTGEDDGKMHPALAGGREQQAGWKRKKKSAAQPLKARLHSDKDHRWVRPLDTKLTGTWLHMEPRVHVLKWHGDTMCPQVPRPHPGMTLDNSADNAERIPGTL